MATSAEAHERDRRGCPIIIVVANVERGDAEAFRRSVTGVGQAVAALVAIGDGTDAERTRRACTRACSSSCGVELLNDIGGCIRERTMVITIAMVITGTGWIARGRCVRR